MFLDFVLQHLSGILILIFTCYPERYSFSLSLFLSLSLSLSLFLSLSLSLPLPLPLSLSLSPSPSLSLHEIPPSSSRPIQPPLFQRDGQALASMGASSLATAGKNSRLNFSLKFAFAFQQFEIELEAEAQPD